jgi:hypothetical protein
MRRFAVLLVGLVALLAVVPGGATAAGGKKMIEGTVYDATCVTACPPPCPPPCGPVPVQRSRSDVICAQARIVCPLYSSPRICLPWTNCGNHPIYTGEGSLVNVRKRGSATLITRLPIVQGHFKIRLAPGEYVFHPYYAEEQCWSGPPAMIKVTAKLKSPVPATLNVTNTCVVHSDGK